MRFDVVVLPLVLDLDEGGFSCRDDVVGGFIASALAVDEALDSPLGVLRVLRVLDLGSLPKEDTIGEQSGGVEAEAIASPVGCAGIKGNICFITSAERSFPLRWLQTYE